MCLQLRKKLAEKAKEGTLKANGEPKPAPKKRGRWDQTDDAPTPKKASGTTATPTSWDNADVSELIHRISFSKPTKPIDLITFRMLSGNASSDQMG